MLALRLAAGQGVEQVAELYRVSVARVARRARGILLRAFVAGIREAAALPPAHRLLRLAGIAAFTLACEIRGGHGPAIAFAEHCWARRRDPGLVIARMAQRLLARLERLPDHPPPSRRGVAPTRGGRPAALTAVAREVRAYARLLREATLTGAGSTLRYQRQQVEAAPPDERDALARRYRSEAESYRPHPERAPSDAHGYLMPMLPPHLIDPRPD
jgi:hypothetical protein